MCASSACNVSSLKPDLMAQGEVVNQYRPESSSALASPSSDLFRPFNGTCSADYPIETLTDDSAPLVRDYMDAFIAGPGTGRNYQADWKHQRDVEVR